MIKAICVFCGEMKFGAFNPCKACSKRPIEEEQIMMSLALTDHYFSEGDLLAVGRDIKVGRYPKLDDATRENLRKTLDQFKRTPAGRLMFGTTESSSREKRKAWWKVW